MIQTSIESLASHKQLNALYDKPTHSKSSIEVNGDSMVPSRSMEFVKNISTDHHLCIPSTGTNLVTTDVE